MNRRWGSPHRPDWNEGPPTSADQHCTLWFATIPASIPLARHTAQRCFNTWGVGGRAGVLDAAQLIVTELVTNCVRHAAERSPHARLSLSLAAGHLELAVTDDHPWVPSVPRSGGLHVIAELVRDFGGRLAIAPAAPSHGKTIRVLLPLSTKSAP